MVCTNAILPDVNGGFLRYSKMMVDMFDDIPIRFRDLFVLFAMRTLLLIPVTAALIHGAVYLGLL